MKLDNLTIGKRSNVTETIFDVLDRTLPYGLDEESINSLDPNIFPTLENELAKFYDCVFRHSSFSRSDAKTNGETWIRLEVKPALITICPNVLYNDDDDSCIFDWTINHKKMSKAAKLGLLLFNRTIIFDPLLNYIPGFSDNSEIEDFAKTLPGSLPEALPDVIEQNEISKSETLNILRFILSLRSDIVSGKIATFNVDFASLYNPEAFEKAHRYSFDNYLPSLVGRFAFPNLEPVEQQYQLRNTERTRSFDETHRIQYTSISELDGG